MAQLTIVYWRDIPAQVLVRSGAARAKVPLAERFQQAIDRAAMRAKLYGTDAYLAEWRQGEPQLVGEDLRAEADRAAAALDTEYTDARLDALAKRGGLDG